MPKKRVTRKELLKKPDEFMTFTGKLIRFATEYKKAIIFAFGMLFTVVIVVSLVKYFSGRSEMEAFTMLAEAKLKYTETKKKDKDKAFVEAEKQYSAILEKYSGKQGGKFAKANFADICHAAGKYDQAIKLYEEALNDFKNYPSVRNLILAGLGHCHAEKKEYDEAMVYFEKIVSGSVPIMKEDAYVNLWGLYSMKGDDAKSKETAAKIVADYPNSVYVDLIKDQAEVEIEVEPKTEG